MADRHLFSTAAKLAARAQLLAQAAREVFGRREAEVGEARRELQLAATWHLRRSGEKGSTDNRIFAHGSAEQVLGALAMDPVVLLGFKAAGALVYPALLRAAEALPNGNFLDHAALALLDPSLRQFCAELGSYLRFQWKVAVYREAVQAWKLTAAANDQNAAWRRRRVTAKQRYLIEMVAECLSAMGAAVETAGIRTRGQAHDWLAEQGGNPVFWHSPQPPKL